MRFFRKKFLFCLLCLFLGFGAFLSAPAHAEESIEKVLTTTSSTPVALTESGGISAACSTVGCDIVGYGWYDGNGQVTGKFSTAVVRVEMSLQAWDGFSFRPDVRVYLNNSSVTATVSADGKSLSFSREYAPMVWEPTVIKQPGAETVEAGGWCSFVSTANYAGGGRWHFLSPEGKYFSALEVTDKFSDLSIDDNGAGKVILYNIPAEMDGWRALCRFEGAGGFTKDSNAAKITVKSAATPMPEPTPEPAPEPTPEPTPEATEAPHEHSFTGRYSGDAMYHWQKCECGESGEKQEHRLSWSPLDEKTEEGVCPVCGYRQTRQIQKDLAAEREKEVERLGKLETLFRVLLGLLALLIVFLLISYARFRVRKRRAYKRRRR